MRKKEIIRMKKIYRENTSTLLGMQLLEEQEIIDIIDYEWDEVRGIYVIYYTFK